MGCNPPRGRPGRGGNATSDAQGEGIGYSEVNWWARGMALRIPPRLYRRNRYKLLMAEKTWYKHTHAPCHVVFTPSF